MKSRIHILLACAAAIPLLLLCSCDQRPKAAATPAPTKQKVAPPLAPRFKAACDKTAAGKYEEAADAFAQINAENDPSQPLYNWILVHRGLALMMGGKDEDARALFGKLEDAGMFSTDADDKKLAKFFVDLGHTLRTEDPIPVDAAKDVDKWTYDALRLLFFGLKDWNQEKFDDALPLLRQFFSSSPKGPPLWIGDSEYIGKLKEIVGVFAEDYTQYHQITDRMAQAKTPEERKDVIESAKTVRAEMKFPNKLTRALDGLIAELNPKIMAAVHENERLSAEAEEADLKAFAGAKEKGDELMKQYHFDDAKKAYLEPELKQSDRLEQQKGAAKKAQWLSSFKSNLVKDFTRFGYAGPLKSSAGAPINGTIVKADDQQIQIKTARGVGPIQWTDLSQDTVFTAAESFINPDTPPEIASFRKWQLGVFASTAGKKPEAKKLLKEAAELRPVFQAELSMFPETAGK